MPRLVLATAILTLLNSSSIAQQVTQPGTASEIKGTPAGTVMTKEYVETIGRFAYLWGWPLVNNLNRALGVEKLPEPGRIGDVIPAAPPGYIVLRPDQVPPP